jgi:hypothetical protein
MMMTMITPQQEGLGYDHDRESPPAIAAQNVIGVQALDASASSSPSPRYARCCKRLIEIDTSLRVER